MDKEKCVVCGDDFDEYSGDTTEQMCLTCILKRDDPECLKMANEPDDYVSPIKERIAEVNPDALFADGLDGAILGIVERFAMPPVALYDRTKCVEILMKQDMTFEEAEEFFEYNVTGSWVGDGTPCFAILIKNNFSNSSS